MTGLVLPRHVYEAEQKRKEEAHANNLAKSRIHRLDSDDFLTFEDVKAQLALLQAYIDMRREEHAAYTLPKPSGWRLQVLVLTIPEKSAGGVHMIDDSREQRSLASPQGVVLAMGPAAYSDPRRFTVDGEMTPWHSVGDRIQFVKYDASMYQLANGQRLGTLTDTQPVATIDKGWEVPQ